MKYLKTFENIRTPQIGDYVLLDTISQTYGEYKTFLNNNIGVVRDLDNIINHEIGVKFDKVPYSVKAYFSEDNYRIFYDYQIEHISSDKQDLEAVLNSKKYNL